jgi:hypothetical protein
MSPETAQGFNGQGMTVIRAKLAVIPERALPFRTPRGAGAKPWSQLVSVCRECRGCGVTADSILKGVYSRSTATSSDSFPVNLEPELVETGFRRGT